MVELDFSGGAGHPRGRHSNRCKTCRSRKVKCDGRRPTCERCERGLHKCLGYDESVVFVSVEPNAVQPVKRPRDGKTSQHRHSKPEPAGIIFNSSTQLTPVGPCIQPGSVRSPLHLCGFKDQVVMTYFISKLSIGVGASLKTSADAPTLFTILTRDGSNRSTAYLSGLGVAEALFGRIHKVDHLVEHSVQLYGQALRNLRSDLQAPDSKKVRDRAYMNIWSTFLLGIYELVSSTGAFNWLEHSRGAAVLTEMLGPKAFQSPGALALFVTYRTFISIGCIAIRKRCFLEKPEWKAIPWMCRNEKPLSDLLFDLLCDMPGMMEDIDNLLEGANRGDGAADSKLLQQDRVSEHIRMLEQLRWRWEVLYPKACWEIPVNRQTSLSVDENGSPLFDTYLGFENELRATDIVYFNVIRLLLYTMSDQLGLGESLKPLRDVRRYQGPRLNANLLPGQGDRKDHALEVCRTVDYFVQGETDSKGVMVLLFPMQVASMHLADVPRMSVWVRKVLGTLSSSKGWKIGEYLVS